MIAGEARAPSMKEHKKQHFAGDCTYNVLHLQNSFSGLINCLYPYAELESYIKYGLQNRREPHADHLQGDGRLYDDHELDTLHSNVDARAHWS